jgi:glucose-6-phosphate 1-dehydrogenase
MEMTVKEPGLEMKTRVSNLNASFRNEDEQPSDAYEDLLLDVIEGDRSLFLRSALVFLNSCDGACLKQMEILD